MIFADLIYDSEYEEFHSHLVIYLSEIFENVESGLQGDSWIWIHEGNEKVAVDTFSSMKHQIKSATDSKLVSNVISCLSSKLDVNVHRVPIIESHEREDFIEIDWSKIETESDFYKFYLEKVSAPDWHGESLDALADGVVTGGLYYYGPPFNVIHLNFKSVQYELKDFQRKVVDIFTESQEEHGGIMLIRE